MQIIASAQGANSYSTRLSQGIINKLLADHPGSTVVVRNLATQPLPYLEEALVQAYFTPAEGVKLPELQPAALQKGLASVAV